jgi:hypothetical protein
MNLINEFKGVKDSVDAVDFLYKKFGSYNGGMDFVDAVHKGLKKTGRELVWWCGMVDNYHNFSLHPIKLHQLMDNSIGMCMMKIQQRKKLLKFNLQ